jgi:hypothetical protein
MAEPSTPMKVWQILTIVLLVFAACIYGAVRMVGSAGGGDGTVRTSSEVTGQLRSVGGPFGDYQIQPTFCRSGGRPRAGFYRGSALHVSKQGGLELGSIQVRELDGKEHQLKVLVPGKCRDPKDERTCTFVTLKRADCAGFDVLVEDKGKRLSGEGSRVYGFDGHARVSCVLADGTAIEGDLTFRGCD